MEKTGKEGASEPADSAEPPSGRVSPGPGARGRRGRRRPNGHPARPAPFVLYVEGPRDREILGTWARRLSPRLARTMHGSSVILGGRQPARAIAHFRDLQRDLQGEPHEASRQEPIRARAICVLDRDGDATSFESGEPGLEFFTWQRRHIESYLLVPDVLRRCLGVSPADGRAERLLRAHLPEPDDEPVLRELDAKRLLARTGPLAREFGVPLQPGRIARSMRETELHPEVVGLLERLGRALGVAVPARAVLFREP